MKCDAIKRGDAGFIEPAILGANQCAVHSPVTQEYNSSFICTLLYGHEGDHAAHGSGDTQYATWHRDEIKKA